jgi:hypothetical protein
MGVKRRCAGCGCEVRLSYLEELEEHPPVCTRCAFKSAGKPYPEKHPAGGAVGVYRDPLAPVEGEPDRHEFQEALADWVSHYTFHCAPLQARVDERTNIVIVAGRLGVEWTYRLVGVKGVEE